MHTFNMSIQDLMPGLMREGTQPGKVTGVMWTADDKDLSQGNVGS